MTLKRLNLAGAILLFSIPAFAQYSTINPAVAVNSLAGKSQMMVEDMLYKAKPKFKTNPQWGFDDFKLKSSISTSPEDVSVSFLTTNSSKTVCNLHIAVQPDGRIFSGIPSGHPAKIDFTESEINQLNLLKLNSLLIGCGLDNQANPFGGTDKEKEFKFINNFYKNGQIFQKEIEYQGKKIHAQYPSMYLLYRNNYSDLTAMANTVKSAENKSLKNLFGKYQTANKILAAHFREKQGIPQWESFNGFDIALKENLFNKMTTMTDKELDNDIKSISHQAVMATYLLGQREQTESIMDVATLKQAALIYTIQNLGRDYDVRTTDTIFNRQQNVSNNMAMKISKDAISFIKNSNPSVSGYNPKISPTNQQNFKAISAFINKYISDYQLDKVAQVEYENMRKLYPLGTDIGMSKVNTLGFMEDQAKRSGVYQSIMQEYSSY